MSDRIATLQAKLVVAEEKLKQEQYKLRWAGHVHPMDSIRSAQNAVVQACKNECDLLQAQLTALKPNFQTLIEEELVRHNYYMTVLIKRKDKKLMTLKEFKTEQAAAIKETAQIIHALLTTHA